MIDKTIVNQIVTEFLDDKDCFLVDVTVQPGNFIVVEIDSETGVDIDELIRQISAPAEDVLMQIMELELEGKVVRLPGNKIAKA